MKKALIFLCILYFSLLSVKASSFKKDAAMIPAQDSIIGYFKLDKLRTPPYNFWFENEFEYYSVDTIALKQINNELLNDLTIYIVIGTWCSDSQRETPRFVKILDYLGYDLDNITAIGVNRKKKAQGIKLDDLNIELVPTIIFYRDGKEIGRIIEAPTESLEKDFLSIMSNK